MRFGDSKRNWARTDAGLNANPRVTPRRSPCLGFARELVVGVLPRVGRGWPRRRALPRTCGERHEGDER